LSNPGGFVKVTVTGVVEINRRLVTWGLKINDLSPAWEQIGDDLLGDFMMHILDEGGDYGRWSRWAPLRPATVRDRIRKGYGGAHPIMWRTGLLLRSLSGKNQAGNVFIVTPRSLTLGSDVFYAGYQQFGTPHMVARPLIPVDPESGEGHLSWKQRQHIVRRLNDYIIDQIRQAGLQGAP
jgi:hypothetical protein